MNGLPKISCLCVSQNRPSFLERAISYFNLQAYPNRELVIVYDGDNNFLEHPLLKNDRIKIVNVENAAVTLGERRNIALHNCEGEYFCHWDDDDWYHRDRLAIQLESLQESKKEACVLDRVILYDKHAQQAYLSSKRFWEGSILCNTAVVRGRLEYPQIEKGEDHALLMQLVHANHVHMVSAPHLYIYIFHGQNTWDRNHFQQLFDAGYALDLSDCSLIQKILEGECSHHDASEKLSTLESKIKGYAPGNVPKA